MEFNKWDKRFMEMAGVIAGWASCFQENRKIGAVIVKNKRIMTTGYNGAPAGVKTCVERGEGLRRKLNIPSGTRQENAFSSRLDFAAARRHSGFGQIYAPLPARLPVASRQTVPSF